MSFRDFLIQDVRLVVLRVLDEMPGYRSNSSVLASALERFGHSVTRDQVKTELVWLSEQGLVTLDDVEAVAVATLTTRGQDVVKGRVVQPGVKRPGA